MTDSSKKQEAQSHFKKAHQQGDAKSGVAEYEARAAAIRERTEQLKALRLAREASVQAAAPKPKPKAAVRKSTGKADKGKRTTATLAEWLDQQGNSGRRS